MRAGVRALRWLCGRGTSVSCWIAWGPTWVAKPHSPTSKLAMGGGLAAAPHTHGASQTSQPLEREQAAGVGRRAPPVDALPRTASAHTHIHADTCVSGRIRGRRGFRRRHRVLGVMHVGRAIRYFGGRRRPRGH